MIGITAALLWQRYHRTKLPAGAGVLQRPAHWSRCSAAVAAIVWAIAFGFVWPPIGDALNSAAAWMYDNGPLGCRRRTAWSTACSSRPACTTSSTRSSGSRPRECPTATGTTAGDLNCFFNATEDHRQVRPVHDRLLPDHDVRPSGRRVRDGPRGQGQDRRQRPARSRPDRVPHRRHRAAGVLVHVRRTGAVRRPRADHRHVDGHQLRDRRTRVASRSPQARSTTCSTSARRPSRCCCSSSARCWQSCTTSCSGSRSGSGTCARLVDEPDAIAESTRP